MVDVMTYDPLGNPTGYGPAVDPVVAPPKTVTNNNPGLLARIFNNVTPIMLTNPLTAAVTMTASTAKAMTTTPEQAAKEIASNKFKSAFATAMDVTYAEGIQNRLGLLSEQAIIESRGADKTLDAFKKTAPEWGGVVDAIKADDELKASMHKALVKDPTMLAGLTKMTTGSGDGQKADPKELEKYLSSPQNRKILSQVLNKVADDDNVTFEDFNQLYASREDKKKSLAKLMEMGINPASAISSQDMLKMVVSFLRNPSAFLQQLPGMLQDMGILDGPIQADALKNSSAMQFAKGFSGVVLGPITGDKGYGQRLAGGIERFVDYSSSGRLQKDVDDLSGESDRKLKGAQNDVKGDKLNDKFTQSAQGTTTPTPAPATATPAPQRQQPTQAPG